MDIKSFDLNFELNWIELNFELNELNWTEFWANFELNWTELNFNVRQTKRTNQDRRLVRPGTGDQGVMTSDIQKGAGTLAVT